MKETMEIIKLEFGNATIETIQMVLIAMLRPLYSECSLA